MREQVHGGDIYRNKNVIDFSVNSNPLGPPKGVPDAIRESIDKIVCYPDIWCSDLRGSLGRYEEIKKEYILCGNGAAELLFSAAFAVKPKQALLLAPTFAEYEQALCAVGAQIQYAKLEEEKQFNLSQDILDKIGPNLDMMFLCSPNNPTGLPIEPGLMKKIIEKCITCQVYLVLDECFIDFLEAPREYEMKWYLEQTGYLVILKAFTKIFCMPGMRLGYVLCSNTELLRRMKTVMQPWNVSVPAQEAGIAALRDCGEYLSGTRKFVAEERQRLKEALALFGFKVYDSQANYIFFRGRKNLYEQALEAGFLIRDCSSYRGLTDGYYRIAVRTRTENERLISWLKKL